MKTAPNKGNTSDRYAPGDFFVMAQKNSKIIINRIHDQMKGKVSH
jgi:hypothetical protein